MVSELHQRLENVEIQGINGEKIDLYQRFAEIKAKAPTWLSNHGKNGIEHSERLEEYLVKLTQKPCKYGRISTGEIFILLCAAYLHDIGYWHNGKLDPIDHPQRSHDRIINHPDAYSLGNFPLFGGGENRIAKAIALVCLGHSEERYVPLEGIPKEFSDQNLCPDRAMNLRLLAALLRLADETDDPYVRMVDGSFHALRSNTPLVVVGDETIAWHWKDSGDPTPDRFLENLEEKKITLRTATEYLHEIQCGTWYLVLHPQVPGSAPFMAEKPTETFVGREDDLAKIHDIIQKRRAGAVTGVVGTGGIGKTELARMYAEKYFSEYPGGIFWASLKGSSWKNEAPKILAELRPGADPMAFPDDVQAREVVTNALDRKHALLAIDNVDEFDDIIKPACRVLVSTRNKDVFGTIPHDAIHRLDKLDMDAALKLLSKLLGPNRVKQDRPGAERLIEILGGMPLALEISARHLADIPDFTFPDYIGRIQNRIDLLTVENEEDKNVLASLEMSLDGLETLENGSELQDLFFATAVCAATGFKSETLIAAAGLKSMEPFEAKKLVGKLHQRSLLEYHDETKRYSMHALMRQMAETKLSADNERRGKFAQNHCDYFVRYASAHRDDPTGILEERDGLWQAMVQTNQLRELQDRFPKLLEAMTAHYWKMITEEKFEFGFQFLVETSLFSVDKLGRFKVLQNLLEPLTEKVYELSAFSQGWILNNMGKTYASLGQYKTAIIFFEKGLVISNQIKEVTVFCSTLSNLGSAYLQLGQYHKAMDHYKKLLIIIRRIGDVRGEGNALNNLGLLYVYTNKHEIAIDRFQRAIDIARRIEDQYGEASAMGNMGLAYEQLGQPKKAFDHHTKALTMFRRIGDMQGEGNSLGGIGVACASLGQFEAAIEYYKEQLNIVRRIEDIRGEGNALGSLGFAYVSLGRYELGIKYLKEALHISRQIGDLKGESSDLGNLGLAYSNAGQHEIAIDYCERRIEIAQQLDDEPGEGKALVIMGVSYAKLGVSHKARECFIGAMEIFEKLKLEELLEQTRLMIEVNLNISKWRKFKVGLIKKLQMILKLLDNLTSRAN